MQGSGHSVPQIPSLLLQHLLLSLWMIIPNLSLKSIPEGEGIRSATCNGDWCSSIIRPYGMVQYSCCKWPYQPFYLVAKPQCTWHGWHSSHHPSRKCVHAFIIVLKHYKLWKMSLTLSHANINHMSTMDKANNISFSFDTTCLRSNVQLIVVAVLEKVDSNIAMEYVDIRSFPLPRLS